MDEIEPPIHRRHFSVTEVKMDNRVQAKIEKNNINTDSQSELGEYWTPYYAFAGEMLIVGGTDEARLSEIMASPRRGVSVEDINKSVKSDDDYDNQFEQIIDLALDLQNLIVFRKPNSLEEEP